MSQLTTLTEALQGASLTQKVQLIGEVLTVVQALVNELPPILNELKSSDDLLTKIKTIVADIEQTPLDLVNQIKQIIADVSGTSTT